VTDWPAPSQVGLDVTLVTVATTGDRLSERPQVTVHRPVESVVHERVVTLPLSSTMRTETEAPCTTVPFELRTILTRAMAL